tara:strand:- start:1160 stop:1972 length:813 start_codon:yes stop_codon:yes gene_type:complete
VIYELKAVMESIYFVIVTLVIFTFSGFVKGFIGVGLPTISIILIALVFDLYSAIALVIIPALVTNMWQAINGSHFRSLIAEFWLFFLLSGLSVFVGTFLFYSLNTSLTSSILGIIIIFYGVYSLGGKTLKIDKTRTRIYSPIVSILNGILTGMTGTLLVPSLLFFQALGLKRQRLSQALGIQFSILTFFLAFATRSYRSIENEIIYLSLAACACALIGMSLGRRISLFISDERFKKFFLSCLIILGFLIIFKSNFAFFSTGRTTQNYFNP